MQFLLNGLDSVSIINFGNYFKLTSTTSSPASVTFPADTAASRPSSFGTLNSLATARNGSDSIAMTQWSPLRTGRQQQQASKLPPAPVSKSVFDDSTNLYARFCHHLSG